MDNASRDQNYVTTLMGVSSVDNVTPVNIWVDPVTHRVLVDLGGSSIITSTGSSTLNAVPRWNNTTGSSLKDSGVIIDNSNNVTGINQLGVNNRITINQPFTSRYVAIDTYGKDTADAGGVQFTQYTDADNAIVGNRMWQLYGYLKNTTTGANYAFEPFISASFPTADGSSTYTKQIVLNADTVQIQKGLLNLKATGSGNLVGIQAQSASGAYVLTLPNSAGIAGQYLKTDGFGATSWDFNYSQIFNVKNYGAKGDGRTVSDASITTGTATVTSATIAFTAADVGKRVMILGAGTTSGSTFGNAFPLYGTITAVASATSATVSTNALTTVSNAAIYVGTDDSTAINAAITAANAAGGGQVYVPSAMYTCSASIILKSNVDFVGESRSSTTIQGVNNVRLIKTTQSSGHPLNTYSNITVRNIKFNSDNNDTMLITNTTNVRVVDTEHTFVASTYTAETLQILYCQNVFVEDNYVHDNPGDGIQLMATQNFTVTGNIITNSGDDGIDIDIDFVNGVQTYPCLYGTVSNNVVNGDPGGNCIRIENSSYINVVGNSVTSGNGGQGISINCAGSPNMYLNMTDIVVMGNTVYNCLSSSGIITENDTGTTLTNVAVVNNVLDNCGPTSAVNIRAGINLASPNVLCVGNTLNACGSTGGNGGAIVFYKNGGHHIADNYIQNSNIGITAWNGDGMQTYTGVTIIDNHMRGNTTNYDSNTLSQAGIILQTVNNNGIGIKKEAASGNAFDINGKLAVTGFQLSTSPTSGNALVSDASGNGTWGVLGVAGGGTGSATQNFVDLTTNQTIGGAKSFTGTGNFYNKLQLNVQFTGRTSQFEMYGKDSADVGGVYFTTYVDADNAIVGNRMWQLYGYLKNTTTGANYAFEPFISASFPTADGSSTYTKNVTINAPLTVTSLSSGIVTATSGALSVTATNGTGNVVLTTSPTLVTPILGVATATSINKVAITAPSTSATLTLANGSTLALNGAFVTTLTSTATTTATLPSGTVTLAALSVAQTFTARQTLNAGATSTIAVGGNATNLTLTQNDTTNNPNAVSITNSTTSNAILVTQTGNTGTTATSQGAIFLNNTANTGIGIGVYSNQAAGSGALVNILADNHSFTGQVLNVQTSGNNANNILIQHNWNLASTQALVKIQNSGSFVTAGNILQLVLQNASDTGNALLISNSGTGNSIIVNTNDFIVKGGLVGSAITTPTSKLHAGGSFARHSLAISAARTLDVTDSVIFATGTFTVTLPTAVGIQDRLYTIKNSSTGTITVATTSTQTIDGASTYVMSAQYKHVTVISDGANWQIISNN